MISIAIVARNQTRKAYMVFSTSWTQKPSQPHYIINLATFLSQKEPTDSADEAIIYPWVVKYNFPNVVGWPPKGNVEEQ
jgi:hypothetical protein